MTFQPISIVKMIDAKVEADASTEKPFRDHLGGSMIGKVCDRELAYIFRWAKRPSFKGRMLRLFDRGHKEEFRFVEYLRNVGVEVLEYSEFLMYHAESDYYQTIPARFANEPPQEAEIEALCEDVTGIDFHIARAEIQGVKLKQWRVSDINDHFGGSLDGISLAPFDVMDDNGGVIPAGVKFLNEFKTHNTKSFLHLVNLKNVKEAKPVHWAQMQIYMHKRGLEYALYMAVNKNDDDLYAEIVRYDPTEGPKLLAKAERVIAARTLPDRIGKHPSWHECKFCEYAKQCHYAEPFDKNCRSCRYSEPVEAGKWRCHKWDAIIPGDAILKGCDNYSQMTD